MSKMYRPRSFSFSTRNKKNKRAMYNSWENPKGLREHLAISGHGTLLSYTSCSYNLRVGIIWSCHRGSKESNSWTSRFTSDARRWIVVTELTQKPRCRLLVNLANTWRSRLKEESSILGHDVRNLQPSMVSFRSEERQEYHGSSRRMEQWRLALQ